MSFGLSSGAIKRILNGEDAPIPILQILDFKRVSCTNNDQYGVLISDGINGYPFAMLDSQLSYMVANKELERFTVFRVDECVCNHQALEYRKVIILLKLTVLVPGYKVNVKLGNPISSAMDPLSIVLSTGAINRILNGEDVRNPVCQILAFKKMTGAGNDRYRLLLSDGITGYLFAVLSSQLSHMITSNQIEKFTVIRVDKCVCNLIVHNYRKVIMLLKLTVLVPGNKVNVKLGNPISSKMDPVSIVLSPGAINRILNGEDVRCPVFQILAFKKITSTGTDRYRLLISDGITDCQFALLVSQLNHMITNKTIETFAIIRVDKFVCTKVHGDRKVIVLLNVTVLIPGNQVNEKLGNPIYSSTSPSGVVKLTRASPTEPNENGGARGSQSHDTSLSGESPPSVLPINSLMPYLKKWAIKARVISKTITKRSNSHGESKVLSVNLVDDSGEIKATGSNDLAEKYYDMLEPNNIYYISKASLKITSAKVSTDKNPYDITFNDDTMIALCDEAAPPIPMVF